MTKNEKAFLIQGFKNVSQNIADIIAVLEGANTGSAQGQEPTQGQEAALEHSQESAHEHISEPATEHTYEEVRAILAEKARTGFRAEVKAILTAHGVQKLSSVKDPDVYAAIVAEAATIGIATATTESTTESTTGSTTESTTGSTTVSTTGVTGNA